MTFPNTCFICLGATKRAGAETTKTSQTASPPEIVIVSSDDEDDDDKRPRDSKGTSTAITMSKELEVIFILRNLFDIPGEKLETYLSLSRGDSPSKWGIGLCPGCGKTVEHLRSLYQDIQKITRKYNAGKAELCKMVWKSEVKRKIQDRTNNRAGVSKKREETVVEETRRFICENDYFQLETPFDHPFSAGDALAQRLCTQKKNSITIPPQQLRSLGVVNPVVEARVTSSSSNNQGRVHHSKFYNSIACLSRHSVNNLFECPLCGKTFTALIKLKFHAVGLHPEKIFEEDKFNGVTDSKFLQHCFRVLTEVESLLPPRPQNSNVECSKCGKCFVNGKYLQNHWVQFHYDLLATKLRTLQQAEHSREDSLSKVVTPSAQFQCSRCQETFSDAEKLKQHTIIHHPELFFPPSEFNAENIPVGSFRNACELLFRRENIKRLYNNCFLCSMCLARFISVEPVWAHMVETHWEEMSKKLSKILKSITGVSSTISSSAPITTEEPEVISVTPTLPPLDSEQSASSSASYLLQSLVFGRSKRSDAKYPPTLKCNDCNTWFSTAPSLSRHRHHFCPVRRSAGLLKGDRTTPPNFSGSLPFSGPTGSTNIPAASLPSALSIIKDMLDAPCQPYRSVPGGRQQQQMSSMKYPLPRGGGALRSGSVQPQTIFPSSSHRSIPATTVGMATSTLGLPRPSEGKPFVPPPLIAIGQYGAHSAKQTVRKALLAQRERQQAQLNSLHSPKRTKRSDLKHAPTMQCSDCSVWFGTSSALSRHRSYFCTVRRAAGLLRDRSHPRPYTKRVNRDYPVVTSLLNNQSPSLTHSHDASDGLDHFDSDNAPLQNDALLQDWSFSHLFPEPSTQDHEESTGDVGENIVCNVNLDEMSLSYFDEEEEAVNEHHQDIGDEQVVKQEEIGAGGNMFLAPEDDPLAM